LKYDVVYIQLHISYFDLSDSTLRLQEALRIAHQSLWKGMLYIYNIPFDLIIIYIRKKTRICIYFIV